MTWKGEERMGIAGGYDVGGREGGRWEGRGEEGMAGGYDVGGRGVG